MVNYRRFLGEMEIPLDPGVNLVQILPGMGRSTLLEAVSWCLLGNELISNPHQVPNLDALGRGMTEVRVGLSFTNGETLERFALFAVLPEGVRQQGWGWRLKSTVDGLTIAEGDDGEEFGEHQERLFPEACVHANLMDGPDLVRVLEGCLSGPERAVMCSDNWCTSDLSLRCAMEATGLFHRLCPEGGVDALEYDPDGRLMLSVQRRLTEEEVRMALLSHALAFARENGRVCPIIMVDPFGDSCREDRARSYSEMLDVFPDRQLILLLSDPLDVVALRSTGNVKKEVEIRG